MNKTVLDFFSQDTENNKIPNILLPHQLATLDFLIKQCYYKKQNVLIYHKMGSGKTILNLSFALIASKTNKILIVVPNINLIAIWKDNLIKCLSILGNNLDINLDNINIISRVKFMEEINKFNFDFAERVKLYENYFIIIDEVHNYFGNTSGINLIKLKKYFNSVFIILTGSPITNTIEPLKDIIYLLTGKDDFKNNFIEKGNKVYEIAITNEGKKYIRNNLFKHISYYNETEVTIPKAYFEGKVLIHYPFTICPMSELQIYWYNKIKNEMNEQNEMFSKILNNVSFCVLGDVSIYDEIIKGNTNLNKELLPGLEIHGKYLYGEELIKLNISSKLKFLIDKYVLNIDPVKKFIYFNNSTVGSVIIRSVMEANGISEYGKNIVKNFRCVYCNRNRTCKICFPAKFVIITSLGEVENINTILKRFNNENNDDGKNLMFLFGSKIISEAYTLKEVFQIIFLSIPSSKSELEQIIARALRKFSYKSQKKNVEIKILVALDKNDKNNKKILETQNIVSEKFTTSTNLDLVNYYIKLLNNENLNYDLKKILYLEIKSSHSDSILKSFKELNWLYNDNISKEIYPIMYYEILKRYFYREKFIINIDSIFYKNNNYIVPLEYIYKQNLNNIILYNKEFKKSFIVNIKDKVYHIIPIKIMQNNYLMSLDIENFY